MTTTGPGGPGGMPDAGQQEAPQHGPPPAPGSGPLADGVSVLLRQSGGTDAVIAAVTAATLVPFVQALMSRAADSTYDWVRKHLRAGRPVRVQCPQRQLLITVSGGTDDAALAQLERLDLSQLPVPCELRWDDRTRSWRAAAR